MTSGYREIGPDGKVPPYAYPSSTPETKGSQYQENTPTFESLHSGNAGRGIMGVPGMSRGEVHPPSAQPHMANGGMVGHKHPAPPMAPPASTATPAANTGGMHSGGPVGPASYPKKPNAPFKPFGSQPDAKPQ